VLAAASVVAGRTIGTGELEHSSLAYVDIPANQTSADVVIKAVDDARLEPTETATFSLVGGAGYVVAQPSFIAISIADNDEVKINFQPASSAVPAGFLPDTGLTFAARGNGLSYGWDADNTANARRRNDARSPDASYDTFNHMQKNGANRRWEFALPNGLYQVTLAAGDPDATDSVYRMNLENTLALSGTPAGGVHWFKRTVNVRVTDGRLTLGNAAGAVNNKIDWIDIKAAPPGAVEGPVTDNLPVGLLPIVTGIRQFPVGVFAKKLLS
jgi:hypothetical protein